ncbi:MAG: hypothetical protein HBSAPP02_05670 [Phycisphaerae bacterium]|nr:MAG: hypothetical protein HRU71_10645 [Planctomycetia bacterium]RIK66057.1 MAG: hypothetical protein DCC66_13710 [Planctomycetota bacterium]GJQ25535.1 MAG: hypothetical protein HBSAPP02_05670 [Phycisphaerae bacterium]
MAWVLNILFPGVGLILRRREWLGLTHAVLFSLCANLAIAAWLIAPDAIPGWLAVLATIFTFLAWLAAQGLLARHEMEIRRRAKVLAALIQEARQSLGSNRLEVARVALESALEIDSEHPEVKGLWDRLGAMDVGGRPEAPPCPESGRSSVVGG